MTSPRERAARKLYDMEPPKMRFAFSGVTASVSWDEASAEQHAVYFARVDAVLDELLDPSEAGIRAGGGALDYPSVYMGGPSKNGMRKARAVWDAMIDTIKRGE